MRRKRIRRKKEHNSEKSNIIAKTGRRKRQQIQLNEN